MHRRHSLQALAVGLGASGFSLNAWAKVEQARILAGYPAGTAVDTLGRQLAERMRPAYASSLVVENKVGVSGQLAVLATKVARADGATLLVSPISTFSVVPHTFSKVAFDPFSDLIPVGSCTKNDFALAIGPSVPPEVDDLAKYLAWCKANPRSASFGSGATGTKIHFAGIRLGQLAGVKLEHVGYSNAGLAMTDLVGGNIPAYVGSVPTVLPFAQKVRILATTGSRRSRFLPDVPTLGEAGYKELAFDESMGLYLPRGTPQETVALLYQSMAQAMRSPAVAETLAVAGIEVRTGTGAELAQQIRAESDFWGGIVKSLGFRQDS